jgi:hypothetical protein
MTDTVHTNPKRNAKYAYEQAFDSWLKALTEIEDFETARKFAWTLATTTTAIAPTWWA